MADQCIVCLENLDAEPGDAPPFAEDPSALSAVDGTDAGTASNSTTTVITTTEQVHPEHENVAVIEACGHTLHDSCLRAWSSQANSCPICRQTFNLVHVFDKVGGTPLSSYTVEDKKQPVAEANFEQVPDDNPDENEEQVPCPVCNLSDNEEVLLLCDGCDTPYHTYCLGLDSVPRGAWFCMECVDSLGHEITEPAVRAHNQQRNSRHFFPRTQASRRRARQHARSDQWQGAWGQIAGRIWDVLSIDLDYQDDDDPVDWEGFRRSQQLRERERQEYERWQQRLNIASRLGARDVFENHIPSVFPPLANTRSLPTQETQEERKAWGALDKARSIDNQASRKRKSRSATAEPEAHQEPERKLKRPRTRRLPAQNGEPSSSKATPSSPANQAEQSRLPPVASSSRPNNTAPSFLAALLKEVEMSTPSDDENLRNLYGPIPGANDAPSPVASPPGSGYNSPRASSSTPPPHRNGRPNSPVLSLSSHIEPIYPPANYSPTRSSPPPAKYSSNDNRSSPENSDSEHRSRHNGVSELRQPRPRRAQPTVKLPKADELSPTKSPLPYEMKENISNIVRAALKPHWKSSQLTAEQYAAINRDVSRKLYEGVTDRTSIDEEAKQVWEKIATKEVARAVSDLRA